MDVKHSVIKGLPGINDYVLMNHAYGFGICRLGRSSIAYSQIRGSVHYEQNCMFYGVI